METARLRSWHIALIGVALFALLRFALPAFGTLPRTITADEADALLGAKLLTESMSADGIIDDVVAHDAAPLDLPSLKTRLKTGFETTASHPRLAALAPDRTPQRAVLEAPLPRWLGALGIGVLPASPTTTNLARASSAATLAIVLALLLILWHLRADASRALLTSAIVLATPGVIDAAASAGHGASAIFVAALTFVSLDRVLTRASIFALATFALAVGLTLGVHPMALVLWVVALVAWAIRHRGADSANRDTSLRLPSVPLGLLLVPALAILVLIAIWPALWNETGKRLGAWLLDFGSSQTPPHTVLGMTFDQASGRSAQAFTAVLQWVAWTPIPVLALWLVGLARAIKEGRGGQWAPIATLAAWLIVGSLDGSLFGARNSLLALVWVPTALTAGTGAVATLAYVHTRAASLPWLGAMSPRLRGGLVVALLLIAPILQSARGTSFGLARGTGAELRWPIPVAILEALTTRPTWPVVDLGPHYLHLRPGLEALREGLMLDLSEGNRNEADVELVTSAGPPSPPTPDAREVAHDVRSGIFLSLWELHASGALDKQPALPH